VRFVDWLEKKFDRFAIPHLTEGLIAGQVITYLALKTETIQEHLLPLVPGLVLQGEVWRLFTFLFIPPVMLIPIFLVFYWLIFYIMGTALESHWGRFRYNLFVLLGYFGSLITICIVLWDVHPELAVFHVSSRSSAFLYMSVFLGFAYLNPEYVLRLFFIIPVQVKWLALLNWLGIAYYFITGSGSSRLLVAGSLINFFIFFGADIIRNLMWSRRRMVTRAADLAERFKPRHVCQVCKITDKTHPQMLFRYCSKCKGSAAYCSDHIQNHDHIS